MNNTKIEPTNESTMQISINEFARLKDIETRFAIIK